MIDSIKPSKGLWFPVVITQLSINATIEVAKNEEKVKAWLAIFTKASTKPPQIVGQRIGAKILDELKEIKTM